MAVTNHLMGVTEIASLIGVSRQRADQIVRTKGFPDPVAELAAGRVWETQIVRAWIDGGGLRTVRHTRKAVAGAPSGIPQHCYACGKRLEYVDRGEGGVSLECPDLTLDLLDDSGANQEAARLNQVLANRHGWRTSEVNAWWNTPNPALAGDSPTAVWLRGDRSIVRSLIEETQARLVNYPSLQDALRIARDDYFSERKELARRGPGNVMIGRVRNIDGRFELDSVRVLAEHEWNREPHEYVVIRVEGLRCPVCGRLGTSGGEWRSTNAVGVLVTGLDPENCVGCHDTLTTHGIAPRIFAPDGSSTAIERPAT
jgi:prophage regulatory protein